MSKTDLCIEACRGNVDGVRNLLGRRHTVSEGNTREGASPLHYACGKGRVQVARLLLDNGDPINLPDKKGATPLHYASLYGQLEVVQLLLGRGAAVNATNGNGSTPLHRACRNGHVEVGRLLLEYGADPLLRTNDNADYRNATPLDLAKAMNHHEMAVLLDNAERFVHYHADIALNGMFCASASPHSCVLQL